MFCIILSQKIVRKVKNNVSINFQIIIQLFILKHLYSENNTKGPLAVHALTNTRTAIHSHGYLISQSRGGSTKHNIMQIQVKSMS